MRGSLPLAAIALLITVSGLAVAVHDTSTGAVDPLDAGRQDLIRFPSAFDLFLLPFDLSHAGDLAAATELPGPNAPLSPDMGVLSTRVGPLDLPYDLLSLDPGFHASYDAPIAIPNVSSKPLRIAAAGPSDLITFSSQATLDTTTTDPSADRSDRAAGDGGPETHSADAASTGPSLADRAKDAWNELGPAGKTAVTAGALGLLVFGPLAMYSRIKRDDALKNDTRRKIYEIVETNPSICIKDVADMAGVSYSTASYHLDRLVKTGFLVSNEQGNRVLYYKNGGTFSRDERDLVPILKNDECMRVFTQILEHPWCYRAEVAQALGVSHTTVNWHLKRLIEAELVEEHREGRNCHLFIDKPALDRLTAVLDKMDEVGSTEDLVMQPTPMAA